MRSLGDYDTSTVIYGKFTTYQPSTGAPFTLAGTPAISVYKDNSTTESTSGVTLTADFDSRTGLNHFAIDTSSDLTFYAAGSNFDIVITAGTVDSVSSVGGAVASFTLRKSASLKPTVAGRTLDVSTGGEAGVDWANVGSPTTTNALTNTTISTSQVVASVTAAVTANTTQFAGQTITAASGVTIPSVIASPTNITAGTIANVTNPVSVTGFTPSDVTAIKAKTDSLTFTVANQVDSNVQYVNDTQVTGNGQSGTEWGPV